MANDPIIEIKPTFGGVTLNLNEVWRRLRRKPQVHKIESLAERFLQLFNDHGIEITQIPRWLPALSLAELSQTSKLLAALTPAVLEQTAQIFGIQRTWLEGASPGIYVTHTCYQQPEALFVLLKRLKLERCSFPVRALTGAKTLDCHDGCEQPLALVLVEKIANAEGVENVWDIDRYHVFCDSWNWGYAKTRIQLKGMVRVIDQVIGERVPLYRATTAEVEAIQEGRLIPRKFFKRSPLTNPSLEDYTSSAKEHSQAKETEELADVIGYVTGAGLEEMARTVRG